MKAKHYDTIIIGSGASGMTAAIFAARKGESVCVLEHRSEPGKKLLVTGNGKCNITHEGITAEDYYPEDRPQDRTKKEFLKKAFDIFCYRETIDFFRSLGVLTRSREGYVYPYSERAVSVRNALRDEMRRLGVNVLTQTCVKEISLSRDENVKTPKKYLCRTEKKSSGENEENNCLLSSGRLILATGLFAGMKENSVSESKNDLSGIEIAAQFGIKPKKAMPALVKLKTEDDFCKGTAGVRHKACISLFSDLPDREMPEPLASDMGEIQFAEDALSGIPVFNVSRSANEAMEEGSKVYAEIDLIPDISAEDCLSFVNEGIKRMGERKLTDFFGGMLNDKLVRAVAGTIGENAGKKVSETDPEKIREMMKIFKKWKVRITGSYGFENAQVCTGGIRISDIDPGSMQIKEVPGLFAAGELADIDGPCGGYNLQWAWTSGAIAGGI